MPVAPTYPGVYVEEVPSGVRTITGVATSITAFVGRTYRGPTNDPVLINSFADFERRFGGLQANYPLSYSVRDFFVNGGSQGLIVRLTHPNFSTEQARQTALKNLAAAQRVSKAVSGANDPAAAKAAAEGQWNAIKDDPNMSQAEKDAAKAVFDAVKAAADLPEAKIESVRAAATSSEPETPAGPAMLRLATETTGDTLVLQAANPGTWGNELAAHVDYDGIQGVVGDRYKAFGIKEEHLFNLTIRNLSTGVTEQFRNVVIFPDNPRGVDNVLSNGSNLVRVVTLSNNKPALTDTVIKPELQKIVDAGNADGATEQQKKDGAAAQKVIDAIVANVPFKPTDELRYIRVLADDTGNNGGWLEQSDFTTGDGLQDNKRGLYALDKADLFNLLCIPPEEPGGTTNKDIYVDALAYCHAHRAMLIVDSPANWSANKETAAANAKAGLPELNLNGEAARNAALYFPRVIQADPLRDGQSGVFVPCGIIAGLMARTDTTRGVWKAPAGLDAALNGIQGLEVNLNDAESGLLNPVGVNCLRFFPAAGRVAWGARTLRGADQLADEYKYIPVRRLALFLEESLYRGLQWVVFEPNDEPLWAQIRLNVGAFMNNLFRQGAFQGTTPREAYFVKCDKETTTQNDINLGIVNIVVGFAPLKPAEFVIIKIQQIAGDIQT
jgi:phage tail sheath protein FI